MSLSESDLKLVEQAKREWMDVGTSTVTDRPAAEAAVSALYRSRGFKAPQYIWQPSPLACLKRIRQDTGVSLPSALSGGWRLNSDIPSVAFYRFPQQHWNVKYSDSDAADLDLWEALTRSCDWIWPYEHVCVMSDRPVICSMEQAGDRWRLHSEDGQSCGYADGWGVWSWHGVTVSRQVIEAPWDLDPQAIVSESNSEVRRVMVERFGADRLMREAHGREIGRDLDQFGRPRILLQFGEGTDPVTVCQVHNSTPEPDGSYRIYGLLVPPDARAAYESPSWLSRRHELGMDTSSLPLRSPWNPAAAVAWTFFQTEEEYQAGIES